MKYLLPALLAWAIAQAIKLLLTSVRQRRLYLRALADTGGMPSSHSAIVMGLTTAVGRYDGLSSATFAIALIFSIVVMYDAQGVRRAAGRQAEVLNRLIEDVFAQRGLREERLRELIGHTPFQVLVGAALGVAVGLLPL
ncbi:MAG: divergent PAP2 family protein [Candidatus Dormibacteraeota bacterium]|nr:divergent PAP2 family protein [Candidatus Dormibacteraeota bacterium]MBO0704644.1 divergent PAP2 family protein [Candidatus Dormibacteraeota bacterium]MBO0761406.1 divergent PAP2 family protein [Candidatus Dormibacteraeota bacterium]